jgi:hypothetical protein
MEAETALRDPGPPAHGGSGCAAVVWIGPEGAMIARRNAAGEVDILDIPRSSAGPDHPRHYLVEVVDGIGAAARVVVLGPDTLRLDLAREFVAIGHRPDSIVDVSPHEQLDRDAILARLASIPA